jgi:hypothetical protein
MATATAATETRLPGIEALARRMREQSDLHAVADRLRRPLWHIAAERKAAQRDLKIVICANAETGVGKTSLAVFLAYALDTSPTGFDVAEQATLDTSEYRNAYDELPKGSALILDEAEQLDARRAMSDENVDTAFAWQTQRIREITTLLTLPTWGDLEKRMREMTDVRIEILRRGVALVHLRDRDRYEQSGTFWKPVQTLTWPDMAGIRGYEELAEMKEEFLEGADARKLVDEETLQERLKDQTKELRQEKKKMQAKALYFDPEKDMTQADVAEELDVSRRRVGQLVNS